MKKIVKKTTTKEQIKESVKVKIKSAGVIEGNHKIILDNDMILDGVEEIQSIKPGYADGCYATIKVWIPMKKIPITKPTFDK